MKLILTSSAEHVGEALAQEFNHPEKTRLLFIVTAAEGEKNGVNSSFIAKDRAGLEKADFQITEDTITGKSQNEIRDMLVKTDFCFVNGGNNFYLLKQMRETGFDVEIKDFLARGGVYGGSSAGSVIVGPDVEPTRILESGDFGIQDTRGLNLVDFVVMPHWGSETFKDLYLHDRLEHAYSGEMPLIFLGDQQYLVVIDKKIEVKNVKK